jgi:hypothetical protein
MGSAPVSEQVSAWDELSDQATVSEQVSAQATVWEEASEQARASGQATVSDLQAASASPERKSYWLVAPRWLTTAMGSQ